MNGFEIYAQITFGTSLDPKQRRRRKNKSKKNRKKELGEFRNDAETLGSKIVSSKVDPLDTSDSSDSELNTESHQKISQKKVKKRLSAMQLFKIRKEELTHFRRTHKIYITGDDIPDPIEKFDQLINDFNVDGILLKNINKFGYLNPTPVQMQAIPLMLHNRQILACAPTGSGKTAAFLIPLIHNLKSSEKVGIRAVIIAPTRELVKQIFSFCIKLSEGTGLQSLIIENVNEVKSQPEFLNEHDILISTPNRLIYLLKNDPPILNLNSVQWLIVDECDKLFEAGKEKTSFRDQLAVIYNSCGSSNLRRAMFSATFAHEVEEWCKLNIDSLVSMSIGTKNTAVETIKQELLYVGCEGGKLLALRNLLQEGFMPPVLVFVQSKERARELYAEMAYFCVRVDVIHADLMQEERDKVVQSFINGKVWVLICTELMARGIDFKGVNLVINYDFPPSAISYIHRIGRTGRAGEEGRAVTYFSTDDVENVKSIAQVMKNAGCEVPGYIMSLKSKKKTKGEIIRPVKRQKISTAPTYGFQKPLHKRKPMQKTTKKKKNAQNKA